LLEINNKHLNAEIESKCTILSEKKSLIEKLSTNLEEMNKEYESMRKDRDI